jgi:TRAP transporter 4TM/12TM fusion protein
MGKIRELWHHIVLKRISEDKESSPKHELRGCWRYLLITLGVSMSVFQIYTAGFGVFPAMIQRSIHLAFGFSIAFLMYPLIRKQSRSAAFRMIDLVITIVAVFVALHLTFSWEDIVMRMGRLSKMDIISGAILIVLLLDMGRRTLGWPLPLISIAALIYSHLGPYMPGMISHRGNSIPKIIAYMYTTTEGVFGIPMDMSATVVYAFVVLGTFLLQTGVGDLIVDAANAIAGKMRGGPAKIATISSAFFGMVSGSAVANVVTTGTFTIPMMKRIGFKPSFAGAVEAVASTGGQIMPPVMGAAAFIMAELVGKPYVDVCIAAAVPACLYYLAIFFTIHFRALKTNMKGLKEEELPKLSKVLRDRGHLVIAPLFLVYFLIVVRYSAMKSAFLTIPIAIVVSMLRSKTRLSVPKVIKAMTDAAYVSVQIIAACGLAGIIMAVTTQTGLGLKFSNLIVTLAHNQLFLTLILVMITSLILGTGMTTSAAYIIASLLGVPALENLGVPAMAAHLFTLYFAVISFITPPVAIAAYAAAGIAGANPFETGFVATRIGLAGFIIPFMFVYGPALILVGSPLEIGIAVVTAVLGVLALASSLEGYLLINCKWWERAALFVSAFLLIKPGIYTDLCGIVAVGIVSIKQYLEKRKYKILL